MLVISHIHCQPSTFSIEYIPVHNQSIPETKLFESVNRCCLPCSLISTHHRYCFLRIKRNIRLSVADNIIHPSKSILSVGNYITACIPCIGLCSPVNWELKHGYSDLMQFLSNSVSPSMLQSAQQKWMLAQWSRVGVTETFAVPNPCSAF